MQELSDKLSKANELRVDIPSPNTSQQKFKAVSFRRVPVSVDETPCDPTPGAASKQDVTSIILSTQSLKEESECVMLSFPRKLSEAVYRVTVTSGGYSSDVFVMKIARNMTDQTKLLAECEEYLRMEANQRQQLLRSGGVAPSVTARLFGMFKCSLGRGGTYKILVLAYAGNPAERFLEASQSENCRHMQKVNEVSKYVRAILRKSIYSITE